MHRQRAGEDLEALNLVWVGVRTRQEAIGFERPFQSQQLAARVAGGRKESYALSGYRVLYGVSWRAIGGTPLFLCSLFLFPR